MSDDMLPSLKISRAGIPEKLLVVGDPARVDRVAGKLEGPTHLGHNREYRIVKGSYQGVEVGVVSHGVGSAGAGLCFEELCRAGAERMIRAGSAGGMQGDVVAGDLVIATAAVREDGLSPKLVPVGYPAFAAADVLLALRRAARALGYDYHEGIVLTSDVFYPHDILGSDLHLWQRAGVTAVEMEAATLMVVAGLHGVETGVVLAIDGNPLTRDKGSMEHYDPHNNTVKDAVNRCIEVALTALVS